MVRGMLMSLAAAATLSCAVGAQAQSERDLEVVVTERADPAGFPGPPGYESRDLGYVYDNLSLTFGQSPTRWGSVVNWRHGLEDISFVPGPWAAVATRLMDQMSWGVRRAAGGPYDVDVNFKFWDKDDVTFAGSLGTGTTMIAAGAVPLADLTILLRNQGTPAGGAVANQFTTSLAGLPGGGVSVPDDGFFLEISIFDAGTTTFATNDNYRIIVATNSTAPAGGNPATVGSTAPDVGFDADVDGVFLGEPAAGGTTERRAYVLTNATPNRAAGYMVRFRGDIPPPPPPTAIDLGCIADTGVARSDTLAANTAQWYQVCLVDAANDAALHFLDADTEGSGVDCSMAIFTATGTLISADADGGSGGSAQLSFGVGRRAALGDGLQYDGRHGQLAAGTYYIAVAEAGSTFGDGFTASATGAGGSISLNLATNVNGAALAPSVIPLINHVDYDAVIPGGPISFPDARGGTALNTGLRGVLWSTFETIGNAGDATAFLDVDFSRLSSIGGDGVAYIFNANGDVVAVSDNDGPNNAPQFSFGVGDGSPRTYSPNPNIFTGLNGSLPAGRYYIAMALTATQDINGSPAGGRFHVRGTSGSNFPVGADIYTGGDPGGNPCDFADANCDGALNGFDVEAMEQAVNGDFSNYCLTTDDPNQDGASNGFDIEFIEGLINVC
ncbi:hypothetical protein PHYC_03798 [Phycisphaerales bacterium]|nr:hypothetical protein PHYC_03798 [Phycisphaerales bacterium]